ncbi:PEP/pyruvate-binding domain-containing protein [Pelagibius marinus]|uniref:PEP/pyruvate-binding domain-containing protein n=1 Tax=Pelagibius marinus TaxID=2762760 RepID=UPI001872CE75|nr:PEP/pyruvate-binding domain-containing protein [Pelagibius marinus]
MAELSGDFRQTEESMKWHFRQESGCQVVEDDLQGKSGCRQSFVAETPKEQVARFCLDAEDIRQLSRWVARIEAHYGHPLDAEWAQVCSSTTTEMLRSPQAQKSDAVEEAAEWHLRTLAMPAVQ